MQHLYITENNFKKLINSLSKDYDVYAPYPKEDDYYTKKYSPTLEEPFVFNKYRTVEPLKTFLFPANSTVAKYFTTEEDKQSKPLLLLGVKSCDLFSLKIMDFVFKEGQVQDPFYMRKRDSMFIIASDCTDYKEVCFCLRLGINPYPEIDFDLNISPVIDGYLVTVGSEKGKELVSKNSSYFHATTEGQNSAQDIKRKSLIKKLTEHLNSQKIPEPASIPQAVKKSFNSDIWKEEASTCVECGACNFICCTCHCFILSDREKDGINERLLSWDACLYQNFARVAGGANPMKRRYQRLRNRYMKKFTFFPDNINLNGCTGCGRCVETCPGKIDIRKILSSLEA